MRTVQHQEHRVELQLATLLVLPGERNPQQSDPYPA